ncbi:imidazoleglycerol-phosphate dehydratase HisB [Amylibacter sp.]|nr:imidazoleglycerol-phosphate dehydratase HisB [Amylibacter sp.]
MRTANISRNTAETKILVEINLDGTGQYDNKTGIGFFDHMLDQLSRHSLIDIKVHANGDLHIDDHHTVEDVGIALGKALSQAVGEKRGINRYGSSLLAMDDALVRCALDLSGRPFLVWNVNIPASKIGTFDTELVREFFTAFSSQGGLTLNLNALDGFNSHHIVEAVFKSVAQALRTAVETDPKKENEIPSTKGTLSE